MAMGVRVLMLKVSVIPAVVFVFPVVFLFCRVVMVIGIAFVLIVLVSIAGIGVLKMFMVFFPVALVVLLVSIVVVYNITVRFLPVRFSAITMVGHALAGEG